MDLRFSQELKALLLQLEAEPLSLEDLLQRGSEQATSVMIVLLTLPFLLPMPPGAAGPFGAVAALLGLQMALGRSPRLPRRLAQYRFPNILIRPLLLLLHRLSHWVEGISRPRMLNIAHHPWCERLTGLCIAWLALLLMLPIPFTNPIPAIGILLMAIATIESDGLLLCFSYGLTLAISIFFLGLFYGLSNLPISFG